MLVTFLEASASGPGTFIAFSAYTEKDICKSAGWRWDASTKRWFTTDPVRARRLAEYADAAAKVALEITDAAAVQAIAASKAEDAEIDIPAPEGLSYLPYQRAGIAYAISRESCLIADEMGLGKTIQAIGVANVLASGMDVHRHAGVTDDPVPGIGGGNHRGNLKKALIVCPASLRLNWVREWRKWHTGRLRPVVVTDVWPLALRGSDLLAEPCAAILSYEGIVKWKPQLDAIAWDLMILDEVHYAKSPKAKRTKALFGFQKKGHKDHVPAIKAARRIGLSGTPIVNRPMELWPLIHAFDPDGMGGNQKDYRERYVDPPLTPVPPRGLNYNQAVKWRQNYEATAEARRMGELHDRLRSSFMVRRLKADVLKDLPAKRRQIVLLDVEGAGDILAAERRMLADKAAEAQAKRLEIDRLQAAGDAAGHTAAVRRLAVWRGAAMTEISRIRHETAVKKLPAAIEHMFSVLEEAPRIVCWAHHHDVIDGIVAALPGAMLRFDGRMNDKEKAEAVDRFQNDPKVRGMACSIRAGGVGITLTAASTELFFELDWTPSGMVQAEDRCHRIGQKDSVFIQHLVIDGSIDQRMAELLVKKAEVIDAILDGKAPPEMSESILEGVLRG